VKKGKNLDPLAFFPKLDRRCGAQIARVSENRNGRKKLNSGDTLIKSAFQTSKQEEVANSGVRLATDPFFFGCVRSRLQSCWHADSFEHFR